MDRRLFLLTALALAGCATVRAPPPPPGPPYGELEPLYSAVAGPDALTVTVASSGCTARADFVFYVERKGGAVSLALARKRLDTCKSFARGRAEIAFPWAELGLAPATPVFLLNPLAAWTGPGV
jgi:hypothetical protein